MRRALRPSVVVTVSALASVGCKGEPPPVGDASTAESAQVPSAQLPSAAATGPVQHPKVEVDLDAGTYHVRPLDGTVDWSAFDRPMNGRNGEGRVVYRSGPGCHVHLPRETERAPRSWQPPRTETVSCPPSMRSAHWTHCPGGTLQANADGSSCLCTRDGNPPPPPHLQDCPP